MKKKVKSLVIAASVAAIAGIGAVSFAAWSSAGQENVAVSGLQSGTVDATKGFTSESGLKAGNGKKLMPIDQPTIDGSSGGDTEVYYYTVELTPTIIDGNTYDIKAAVTGTKVPTGLKFKVDTTAPTGGASGSASGYNTLNGAKVVDSAASGTKYTIQIILDSNDEAYPADSAGDFTITFTLEAHA